MGWGNGQRRRGAAPRHYQLPSPGPGLLIRQAGVAYGDSSPAGPGADAPMPAGGGSAPTRADRQRYRIPIYNLTTGQPLPDVKGEGNLAVNFDNSAFHSLFPDAESYAGTWHYGKRNDRRKKANPRNYWLPISGDFPKEALTERKTRLETTITALEQERTDLAMTLEAQTLTDDQIVTIESFAREVSKSLEVADQDLGKTPHY